MKKIIIIISVVVFSINMFFNINSIIFKSDVSLLDLLSVNYANAEVTLTDDENGSTAVICDTSTTFCTVTYQDSDGSSTVYKHTKNKTH